MLSILIILLLLLLLWVFWNYSILIHFWYTNFVIDLRILSTLFFGDFFCVYKDRSYTYVHVVLGKIFSWRFYSKILHFLLELMLYIIRWRKCTNHWKAKIKRLMIAVIIWRLKQGYRICEQSQLRRIMDLVKMIKDLRWKNLNLVAGKL